MEYASSCSNTQIKSRMLLFALCYRNSCCSYLMIFFRMHIRNTLPFVRRAFVLFLFDLHYFTVTLIFFDTPLTA